ncbi:tripartite tricarboxylate transporter substrate-binding protein [Roseibium denhamense]|uniref:Tripartite-type tricarboxylate transporter, receptor component TctC n=1 Tax=Roseibium denhamense TaxID=76305 RepID=A0ABY1PAW7_9HYPH|nr:tripartite tricarboxylate transporter substrate-binding protein [Roseibium denhamense]SMP29855.1 Tripartite-type tricarboxylate transporter, receptor component TctC [Roseibium denhamense]
MKILAATAAVAALLTGAAQADWAPSGPIDFVIGFAAGGGTDTLARLIAEDIQAQQGWTVVPKNAEGGGGAVMAREVMAAEPDGQTIGFGITDTFAYGMLASRDPGYGADDFTYLATIAGTQMAVVAKADRGWTTMTDVFEAMRGGESISFGTMTPRLADGAYYIGLQNDVEFNIVSSYKGGRAVLNAINADDVDIGWVAGPQAGGVAAGDLVNLVNGEDIPLSVSPDAQSLSDIGVEYFFGATFLAMAPAGLPDDAREALTEAIVAAIRTEGTKSNAFIERVFVLKVAAGPDAAAYVAKEAADAEALLDATSQ